jgi:hypothetical protein
MTEKRKLWIEVPDLAKIEEKGISINAPTPKQFVIVDPWKPAGSGDVGVSKEGTAARVDSPEDRSIEP